MTPSDLLVIMGGIAAIAWVNWYFLLAGRGSVAPAAEEEGGLRDEEAGT